MGRPLIVGVKEDVQAPEEPVDGMPDAPISVDVDEKVRLRAHKTPYPADHHV